MNAGGLRPRVSFDHRQRDAQCYGAGYDMSGQGEIALHAFGDPGLDGTRVPAAGR